MIIDELKQVFGSDNIIYAHYTGSEVFCTNCKDKDVIVVVKDSIANNRFDRIDGYDVFVRSESYMTKLVNFDVVEQKSLYLISLIKGQAIYGTNPFPDFNLFAHKAELVDLMIRLCEEKYCSQRYHNMKNWNACLQQTIWLFANYFALLNNSLDFTAEQQEILQKCHDNELPRTYADDLYQKLLAMRDNL